MNYLLIYGCPVGPRIKGDERILGDGDFVEKVLNEARESLDRKYTLEAQGYDFAWLVKHVAKLL